jgi:hypothetical protein
VLACAASSVACGILIGSSGDDSPGTPGTPPPVDGSSDGADDVAPEAPGDAAPDASCDGGCAPELVGTPSTLGGYRMVLFGDHLYGVVRLAGLENHVFELGITPGASPEILDSNVASNERPWGQIAADATGVYWATPNGVERARPGEDAGPLGVGVHVSNAVRIISGRLYWTEHAPPGSGAIGSCALPGCTDVLSNLYAYPWDTVQAQGKQYFLADVDAGTMGLFYEGSSQTPLVETMAFNPPPMATDGTRVFWCATDGLYRYTATMPLSATNPTMLLASITGAEIAAITLDANGALYIAKGRDIAACDGATCSAPVTIGTHAGADAIADLAADAAYVYYLTATGSVWRVRKP